MNAPAGRIAIITDSTCDLPTQMLEQYGISVVPLYLLWGEDQLLDGIEITNQSFYERLARDPVHPSTSQPTPADFVGAIEQAEAEEVLIITISQALSGTWESAHQAASMVDVPVRVVNSFSLSMGLGWQVWAAAQVREEGGGIEAMIAAAERVREHTSFLLTVETLEYLHRGGRIGGAAKLLGSLIQLKPLLGVNHTTGTLEAVERTRTRKKALDQLIAETLRRFEPQTPSHIAVVHAAAEEDARQVMQAIERECDPVEMVLSEITPVLGVHGGPGLVAIGAHDA
jgi:DegV family protein with EDD domain